MRKRVLVVDDEASVRDFVSQMLEAEGYDVQAVEDGKQALSRLDGSAYDCLLVDLRMPGVDGLALYQTLKQSNPRLARRMIFCTGELIEGYLRWFLEGTGNLLLSKPFSMRQLLEACGAVCYCTNRD